VSSIAHDQVSKSSKEPASDATQPIEVKPEAEAEAKRGPLMIKITDEQAAGIF
jgi:hypothetical protein